LITDRHVPSFMLVWNRSFAMYLEWKVTLSLPTASSISFECGESWIPWLATEPNQRLPSAFKTSCGTSSSRIGSINRLRILWRHYYFGRATQLESKSESVSELRGVVNIILVRHYSVPRVMLRVIPRVITLDDGHRLFRNDHHVTMWVTDVY